MKFGCFWNQWAVGVLLDSGRFGLMRWFVILVGPLTISIPCGRRTNAALR